MIEPWKEDDIQDSCCVSWLHTEEFIHVHASLRYLIIQLSSWRVQEREEKNGIPSCGVNLVSCLVVSQLASLSLSPLSLSPLSLSFLSRDFEPSVEFNLCGSLCGFSQGRGSADQYVLSGQLQGRGVIVAYLHGAQFVGNCGRSGLRLLSLSKIRWWYKLLW